MMGRHVNLVSEDDDMDTLFSIVERQGFKQVHIWLADAVAGTIEQSVEDSLRAGKPVLPPDTAS
jgi:predicted transcriptional regulator